MPIQIQHWSPLKTSGVVIPCALALLCVLSTRPAAAQEPANQDKLGQGALLAPATNPKAAPADSAPSGAPVDGKKPSDATANAAPTTDNAAAPAGGGVRHGRGGAGHGGDTADKPEKLAYDYELPGPDGKAVPLSTYKGKVLLIVNLAHTSTYADQVAGLEKINEHYGAQGLVVIGVPSNDFGAAEPGTDSDLQKVYKANDKVTFPVMAKSSLTGVQELPFYIWLTGAKAVPENGPVHWNYTKFLVDKDGKVVARFAPDVTPNSPELQSALEQIIAGKYKAPTVGGGGRKGGGAGDDDSD